MKIFLFSFCFFILQTLFSQQNTDSLIHVLKNQEHDCESIQDYLPIIQQLSSSNIEKALNLTEEGILISKKLSCYKPLGSFYIQKAALYYQTNKANKGLIYCDSAISLYSQEGDNKNLIKAFINRSNNHRALGDFPAVISDSYMVLKLSEKEKDTASVAAAYSSLASIYMFLYEYDKALALTQEAKKTYMSIGLEVNAAMDMVNVSKLYEFQKEYDLAEQEIEEAIAIFEKHEFQRGLIGAYRQKGDVLTNKNQFDAALIYLNKALDMALSSQYFSLWIDILVSLEHTYFEKGDYKKSIEYASVLLSQAEQNNLKLHQQNALIMLYESHKKLKNYKQALAYHEALRKINNEIQGEKVQNEINRLKEEFESEKKERLLSEAKRQQLLLERKIERTVILIVVIIGLALLGLLSGILYFKQYRLAQQKQKLELKHQALRAQMNPHFIFNALNSIQRMYVEGNIDKANDFMADFGQLMRRVLEESDKNTITLQEEIATLKLYLDLEQLRSKDSFTYKINVDDDIAMNYFLLPPLILQPFIENAIWHGILPLETKKGEIEITISLQSKNDLLVSIKDNGIGFDVEQVTQKTASKGIKITEQRIGVPIVIKSEKGKGTTVEFTLKTRV